MAISSFVVILLSVILAVDAIEVRECEPIEIPMCHNIGYNLTGYPNILKLESQEEAAAELRKFELLIQNNCSSLLRTFVCSVYTPICSVHVQHTVGPCGKFCERVKNKCEPVLYALTGMRWPENLNCSQFPERNLGDESMCIDPSDNGMDSPTSTTSTTPTPTFVSRRKGHQKPSRGGGRTKKPKTDTSLVIDRHVPPLRGLCDHYRHGKDFFYFINRTERCAHLCDKNILFSREEKQLTEHIMFVAFFLCLVGTGCASFVFFKNTHRMQYPERAIFYLCVCYAMQCVAFMIRFIAGRQNASCHRETQYDVDILIQEGLDNGYCTVIFILYYLFSTAAYSWWVIIAITWMLKSALGYDDERVQRRMTCLSFCAWLFPGVLTVIILVMRMVDADELTAMCNVGQQNRDALLGFVIVPAATYLFLGMCFLFPGVVAILCCQTRPCDEKPPHVPLQQNSSSSFDTCANIKCSGNSTLVNPFSGGDVTLRRIWIFAMCCLPPQLCVLGVNLYEYSHRDTWLINPNMQPNPNLFTLKILASLMIGFSTCFWPCFSDSISLWGTSKYRQSPMGKVQPMPIVYATQYPQQPLMIPHKLHPQYLVPHTMIQYVSAADASSSASSSAPSAKRSSRSGETNL